MQLKSFGCSFIFGTDLADDGRLGPYATVSQLTWPALIAQHLELGYSCYARPGSGNLRIIENIIMQSTDTESAVLVINWTWIDRFDYANHLDNKWQTIMPVDDTSLARTYYKELHSQYRDKLTTLIHINTAIDLLQQKNIPFVMTYMDELIFETQWHCNPAILALQEKVRPHLQTFDGQNFLEWAKLNSYPISPTMHPLEPAHEAAVHLMMPKVLKVIE
jgi:hypothetical protein